MQISDYSWIDSPDFTKRFIKQTSTGPTVRVLLENVHCINCLNKIEKHFDQLSGVEGIRVNLTEHQADLSWDTSKVKLSALFESFDNLGFPATPVDLLKQTSNKIINPHDIYRLAFAGFAMMNTLWFAISVYAGAAGDYLEFFHYAQWVLATPTLFYSGYPFLKGAWKELSNRYLGMNVPLALGISFAYVWSCYALLNPQSGEPYFDTVTNLVFLLLAGRFIDTLVRAKTLNLSERKLYQLPQMALKRLPNNQQQWQPIDSINQNDQIIVRSGEVIPVDGKILEGECDVDESIATGEFEPLHKKTNNKVISGSININGMIVIQASTHANDSFIQQIKKHVEQAKLQKLPIQNITDKILPYFILTTLCLAIATFLFWLDAGVGTAWFNATAVLVITCPCALGLSVPLVSATSIHHLTQKGVLVKNASLMESLHNIKHLFLDKTGTLTKGHATVTEHFYFNNHTQNSDTPKDSTQNSDTQNNSTQENIQQIHHHSYHLAKISSHPMSQALIRFLEQQPNFQQTQSTPSNYTHSSAIIGHGVEGTATINNINHLYRLGKPSWACEQLNLEPETQQKLNDLTQQGSLVCLTHNQQLLAIYCTQDELRDDAKEFINYIKAQQIEPIILSGDTINICQKVAKQLGITQIHAAQTPTQKQQLINQTEQQNPTIFIGDGINDAPALSEATVGVSLASGSGLSASSAEIVLLNNKLMDWHILQNVATKTKRVIIQNLTIALSYNLIMVPIAIAGLVTPIVAAITMPISSIAVILNSLRISR